MEGKTEGHGWGKEGCREGHWEGEGGRVCGGLSRKKEVCGVRRRGRRCGVGLDGMKERCRGEGGRRACHE